MIKTFEAFKKDTFEMPKVSRSELKNCLINNPDTFYRVVAYYNGYTGTSFVVYNNEEGIDELFGGFEDDEIIYKFLHGYYSKDNSFVGFDEDGNFVSFDEIQDHIDVNAVVDWMMKRPQDLDEDVWAEVIECIGR